MTEPVVDQTTQQVYERLPDVFRSRDPETNWTLKKWLSGMGMQIDEVNTLVGRFTYVPIEDGPGHRTSDLTDPMTADVAWLPWLAQLVGVKLDTGLDVADQRAAIKDSILGVKKGSKAAIARAASTVLIGTKEVKVFDHSDDVSVGSATEWDVCLVTKDTETLSNILPVDQSRFSSTNGWTGDAWFANRIAGVAWTTTGMTASTGSTNPLLTNYDTFSGAGNTYTPATAVPGLKYEGQVRLRQTDGLATSADLVLEFMNGGSSIATTTVNVTGIDSNWRKASVSAVAPANTTNVRLKLVRSAAGILQVTTKMVAAGSCGPYFDSSFTGASTDDSIATYPIVNHWRNGSFDVSGGHNVANGTLTATTERFVYGASGGLFEVSATSPSMSPNTTIPVFDGEHVNAYISVLGYQNDGQAQLEIRYTLADGTTSSVFGMTANVTDTEYQVVAASGTAPLNAKSFQVFLKFSNNVGYKYYVDGGYISRVDNVLGYFDGNFDGASWTDANHANALSVYGSALPPNIVTEVFVANSNALKVRAYAANEVVKAQMNPSRSAITVTASDPYTFMLSAYPYQAGSYYFMFQVVFYTAGNVETGRVTSVYPSTTVNTVVDMVAQATMPATTTQARMRLYIYGAQQGEYFGVTRGAARLGSQVGWVAETADPVAAVIKAGAKPAGVILHQQAFTASWAAIEAALPTWADWEGKTWAEIEELGI